MKFTETNNKVTIEYEQSDNETLKRMIKNNLDFVRNLVIAFEERK